MPPEGFVGFSKGLISGNPDVLEQMIFVALCDFTQRATLLGADGPAPHGRDRNRYQTHYPYLPMLCPKTGPGVRWPLARNRDEHAPAPSSTLDGSMARPLRAGSIGAARLSQQSIVFRPCPNFIHEKTNVRRSLPSLNALRSFDAAARHQSFTLAAEELCVTQGAVSHQVKALEAELGVKLFNREPRGLVITRAGRDYLVVVRDAFDRIILGTERLVERQRSGAIMVSTSPDFAAKWLVHRLGSFAEAYPEIELNLSATMHHVDFANEDVDLAIRHGKGDWPRFNAVNLCQPGVFEPFDAKSAQWHWL
jgi:hypothetical protein